MSTPAEETYDEDDSLDITCLLDDNLPRVDEGRWPRA